MPALAEDLRRSRKGKVGRSWYVDDARRLDFLPIVKGKKRVAGGNPAEGVVCNSYPAMCVAASAIFMRMPQDADGVRDGLRLVEIKQPARGSCRGRRGFHLGARASGVGFEVLVKEAGKLFRRGVVCGLVGPTVARTQEFRGHAGALGDDVEAEDRIALRLRARERSAMDRVDDGARVLQADAISDAVRTAAPSRIHEPDARFVLAHLLREELGVLARMPDEERPAEARWEIRPRSV